MESKKLKFEDFKTDRITKTQQKMVRGGDGPTGGEDPKEDDPTGKDPIRGGGGNGNGNGNG